MSTDYESLGSDAAATQSSHTDAKRAKGLPGKFTATGVLKAAHKSPRSRAREFVLQALYQALVGQHDAATVDLYTRDLSGFNKCDSAHYDAVLHGCIEHRAALDVTIEPAIDRPWGEVSPVEHAVLWIGAYELQHCQDVPWRVIINECIELAKAFGGTDGHKWVNGVLNKLAPTIRPAEVAKDQRTR